ncbi:hypothetical protein B0H13DRAFT_1894859 [Mycena leptocephala]|nr:hypothetical protein B0H13DRAFT_1894859 [Mycena leptocephala]
MTKPSRVRGILGWIDLAIGDGQSRGFEDEDEDDDGCWTPLLRGTTHIVCDCTHQRQDLWCRSGQSQRQKEPMYRHKAGMGLAGLFPCDDDEWERSRRRKMGFNCMVTTAVRLRYLERLVDLWSESEFHLIGEAGWSFLPYSQQARMFLGRAGSWRAESVVAAFGCPRAAEGIYARGRVGGTDIAGNWSWSDREAESTAPEKPTEEDQR